MLTYYEVGASLGELPAGYHHLRERRQLGSGSACFDRARERLLSWEMHRRAGLLVPAVGSVHDGQKVEMTLPIGRIRVRVPVQVVAVIDERDRAGFAYGTRLGHPESGEESFLVDRDGDDRVWAEIRAFSRPGLWWMRAGGPIGRRAQAVMTRRYLRALRG